MGQPIEETLVMTSLIYEGIFEMFPEVKVVIVHGGGYCRTTPPVWTATLPRIPSARRT